MRSHRWNLEKSKFTDKPPSTLPPDLLKRLFSHCGPKEGTNEQKDLDEKAGFNYRTVLGELMYCYSSYIPDIGYGITIPSKWYSTTSDYHYSCPENFARYLHITRHWKIRYKSRGPRVDLTKPKYHPIVWDEKNPNLSKTLIREN